MSYISWSNKSPNKYIAVTGGKKVKFELRKNDWWLSMASLIMSWKKESYLDLPRESEITSVKLNLTSLN